MQNIIDQKYSIDIFEGKDGPNNKYIINTLALEGTKTLWDLAKIKVQREKRGVSVRAAHSVLYRRFNGTKVKDRRIPGLKDIGYIQVVGSRVSKGSPAPLYGITVEGLLVALLQEEIWNEIDKIAFAQKDLLPEYFGLWETFEKEDVQDVALKLLKYSIEKLRSGIPTFPEKLNGKKPKLKDWLVRSSIFPEFGVLTNEELKRWMQSSLVNDGFYNIFLETATWMYQSHKDSAESWGELRYKILKGRIWYEIINKYPTRDYYELLRIVKNDKEYWSRLKEIYESVDDEDLEYKIIEDITMAELNLEKV